MGVSIPRSAACLTAIALLGLLAGACDGGTEAADAEFSDPSELSGRTIGVASLSGVPALELRYVLRNAYELDARNSGGDVGLIDSPAESLLGQLRAGQADAVLLSGSAAYGLLADEDAVVLQHVSKEMRDLTGAPVPETVLVTYPDVAERSGRALEELNRVLLQAVAYFEANRSDVIEAVAQEQDANLAYLRWWWDRHELAIGVLSDETQQQMLAVWQAAEALGDIESYPEPAQAVFAASEASAEEGASGRTTISLAVLDDPSRHAALYPIEQGLVTSDAVDIDISYLSQGDLDSAATTKQYSVIEATPLAVPRADGGGLVVLSGGFLDLDGTLLFVRRAR